MLRRLAARPLNWLALALVIAAAGTGAVPDAHASSCTSTNPHLSGSFMQPDLPDGWSTSQWDTELGYLQRACISQVILQWTADSKNQTAEYPTALPYTQETSTDVVNDGLAATESKGMQMYVGLQTNSDWFVKHADDSTWLSGQATIANELADDLYNDYGAYDSFAGWYIPFEVDNFYFTTTTEWDNLVSFFNTITNHLHTLSPGLPVVIAPFFNTSGGQTASQWETMWTYILSRTSIDVLDLQDGVGVGHATVSDLPTWFAATKDAITNSGASTQLWDDAETFNSDLEPMAISSVVADIQAVSSYVSNYTSFSYDHYDSPYQVADEYDETYRGYLANGSVETNPPTTPGTPTATATNSITVSLSWAASCDDTGVVGYQIYRDGTFVTTSYSATPSFTDTQLSPSTTYTYTVKAFDAAGNVSPASGSTSVTTPAGTVYPTNLAAGRSYTTTLAADPSYPDSGGELTDGIYATPYLSDTAWQGRDTASTYSFTIDLGSTQAIHEIDSDWFQYLGASVFLPATVTYAVSTDDSTFTTVGSVNKPAVGTATQSKTYRLIDLSSVSGRYVRVTVTPPSAAWTFIDEIEVRQ